MKRHLLISVDTGKNEEHPGSLGSSNEESTQPEDDSSLILLQVILDFDILTRKHNYLLLSVSELLFCSDWRIINASWLYLKLSSLSAPPFFTAYSDTFRPKVNHREWRKASCSEPCWDLSMTGVKFAKICHRSLKHQLCAVPTWTTLTTKKRETGRVKMTRSSDTRAMNLANIPAPSSHPAEKHNTYRGYHKKRFLVFKGFGLEPSIGTGRSSEILSFSAFPWAQGVQD